MAKKSKKSKHDRPLVMRVAPVAEWMHEFVFLEDAEDIDVGDIDLFKDISIRIIKCQDADVARDRVCDFLTAVAVAMNDADFANVVAARLLRQKRRLVAVMKKPRKNKAK